MDNSVGVRDGLELGSRGLEAEGICCGSWG